MHSGKVHSWKINKWVMAGKNDFPSSDHSPVGFDLIAVNRPDKGIFIYGQLGGKSGNQLNRVKLCLILKSDGARPYQWESGQAGQKRRQSPVFWPQALLFSGIRHFGNKHMRRLFQNHNQSALPGRGCGMRQWHFHLPGAYWRAFSSPPSWIRRWYKSPCWEVIFAVVFPV